MALKFRYVVETERTPEERQKLWNLQETRKVSEISTEEFPVAAMEIGPDGYCYRPLHFKNFETAFDFYEGQKTTVAIARRVFVS